MTVNETLRDDAIRHAIALTSYGNGQVSRMVALLNRTDPDLSAQLQRALEARGSESFSAERIDALLQSVRMLNAQAFTALGRAVEGELRQFAEYEAGYQLSLWQATIPAQVQTAVAITGVSAEQVYAAALARPFQGRLLREWAAGIGEERMTRIRDAVRIGFVENEPIAVIATRIRGTRNRGYTDGVLQTARNHVETIVRTAIAHTASVTRERFNAANARYIGAVSWVATLDTRTSEICRPRDGKQWTADKAHKPIGHKMEWLGGPGRAHMNCRSVDAPVTRSWRELGIDLPEFSPATRASMDGQVPAKETFGTWLRRQSAERQDDVLGATRGALFRRGGLEIEDFSNAKGKWLSLDELRERDAEAFARAKLN